MDTFTNQMVSDIIEILSANNRNGKMVVSDIYPELRNKGYKNLPADKEHFLWLLENEGFEIIEQGRKRLLSI